MGFLESLFNGILIFLTTFIWIIIFIIVLGAVILAIVLLKNRVRGKKDK